jgi:predicted metal-binding protein
MPTILLTPADCSTCEAWREAARVLAAELALQREFTLKVCERLWLCSQHLSIVAERKERRRQG